MVPDETDADQPRGGIRSLDDPETLRHFMRSVGEGVYITDPGGNILDANPAFLGIFGVSSLTELRQFNAADLFADPERRTLEMALLARDGAVREFEIEIVRPDGQRRTVLDSTYQVQDPQTGAFVSYGILVDITPRKALEEQLREQLTRDALTGCYNRRFLLDLGTKLNADAGIQWGCIFIDIDRFKLYNDRHGHMSGDHALQKIARFLMRQVRAEEPVVRMGGDEFLIVLTGENAVLTGEVAARLQHSAARSAPVAFSLGWAQRENGETLEQTLDRADRHLIEVRVLTRPGDAAKLPMEMERRKG